MKLTTTKVETTREIELSRGLEDQDDNLDSLTILFEKLQLVTVEAADPVMDLITFAHNVYYFAVIIERSVTVTRSAQPEGKADVAQGMTDDVGAKKRNKRGERRRRRRLEKRYQQEQQSDLENSVSNVAPPLWCRN